MINERAFFNGTTLKDIITIEKDYLSINIRNKSFDNIEKKDKAILVKNKRRSKTINKSFITKNCYQSFDINIDKAKNLKTAIEKKPSKKNCNHELK